ncbi:MAG: rRNA maturation RNase YbeY [Thermodesulfobacteriota bacterium]|nr:rRNA maturation RNase YbeY [Thermodesulfobacteriota bacterium]
MIIDIQNLSHEGYVDVPSIRQWAACALDRLGRQDSELSIVITDNTYIAELNLEYLGRKGPTNVISFPQNEGQGPAGNNLLGDIVISAQKGLQEATESGIDPAQRLRRLLIHGICHLCGYNHENVSEEKAREMEAMEIFLMEQTGPDE